jgi:hypothetical protein
MSGFHRYIYPPTGFYWWADWYATLGWRRTSEWMMLHRVRR